MRRLVTKRTVLVLLAFLFYLVAWNRDINLLYGMCALLFATLIVSHILPVFSLNGIAVSRSLPSAAFEGDEIEVKVSIENRGRGSRHMIEVVDSIPATEPALRRPMSFVGRLGGKKKREYFFKLPCYKRGEYTVGPLNIRSAYPMGISSVEKSPAEDPPQLLVYPRVFAIAHLPVVSRSAMITSGVEALSRTGGSEDFFGTREYREGDSLRYIHWPSSARHAQLIVKEFEIRASTEVTILMDLQRGSDIGEEKETTLEYAVKIAASIAQYVLEKGHGLQVIGYGKSPHIVSSSRGASQLARVLDALARVEADGEVPYSRAISRSIDHIREGGTVVLIFSRSDYDMEEYLYCLDLLRAKRIWPVGIFIESESFTKSQETVRPRSSDLVAEFMSMGTPLYFVFRGDNLQEIFGA